MTANDTMLWFGIGMPLCLLVLVMLDRIANPMARRIFVHTGDDARVRRIAPAAQPAVTASVSSSGISHTGAAVATPAEVHASPRPIARPNFAPRVDRPRVGRRHVPTIVTSIEPPRPARHPWAPSDGLQRPTADGRTPSAATVRKRAWTAYALIADEKRYGAANIERLQRGRPPLRFNPRSGSLEAMTIEIDEVGRARPYWPDVEQTFDPFWLEATRVPA